MQVFPGYLRARRFIIMHRKLKMIGEQRTTEVEHWMDGQAYAGNSNLIKSALFSTRLTLWDCTRSSRDTITITLRLDRRYSRQGTYLLILKRIGLSFWTLTRVQLSVSTGSVKK